MRKKFGMAALAVVAAACGAGGGGGSSGGSTAADSAVGAIHLLDHAPADGAVQVGLDSTIVLDFDAAVVQDSLGDEDTWLRIAGGAANLPGSFALHNGGRRVVFTPAAPFAIETDYTFQLSGLTCDNGGRLLDTTIGFSFRTLDETPPALQGFSVPHGAVAVSRTGEFVLTFGEAIAPASLGPATLWLRDVYGAYYAAERRTAGATVVLAPYADLPGDRLFTLGVGAVTDRAGNALAAGASVSFRTDLDAVSPNVLTRWPAHNGTGISPQVQPTYTFDESMDPYTVEPSSLVFQDEFGSVVPFAVHASDDQRTLRVRPTLGLQPNRRYTLAFLLGGAAATDVSGNGLAATQALVFTTGTDGTPPAVVSSAPQQGETRVSVNAVITIGFDEALDPAWTDTDTVTVSAGGEQQVAVVELPAANVLRVTPVLALPVASAVTVRLRGGHEGLHDLAGNVLAQDHVLTFTTSADPTLPRAILMPPDGAAGVPLGVHASFLFDAAVDPATVGPATVLVTDDAGTPLPGTLVLGGGNRVATFTPQAPLLPSTYYRMAVRGGSAGVRRASGSWFSADQQARFRTGTATDHTAPVVRATVNGIDESRLAGLALPPSGFTIDAAISDPGDQSLDMGAIEVVLQGPGPAPAPAALFAIATVGYATFQVTVPPELALAPGSWTLSVRARDLSGNVGGSVALPLQIAEPVAALLPFERVQVVWVRTDLDRDGSGSADFDDDLLRLGLGVAGDPAGTNAVLRRLVLDGIVAQSNHLYGRGHRGEPLDAGSVGLRFTARAPIGLAHMQMALGGFDPEGPRNRAYGSESTGVLGRAYYDYRNGDMAERNIGTSPGLGVFPSEMWLYQTAIHISVWPSYQTVFAQKFRPLCPAMGGTAAGAHALDPVVLAPTFDYATANAAQRARWLTIMQAADDWSTVMGIILAHEVGHSVGLVAPGPAPAGLFGDSSLHDTFAGAAEVMAAAVGYEAMTTLDYRFRDTDLAYLRQRILVR